MAKVSFGGGVSGASGKIGGTVYSRNKGGAYFKNWVVPTNPQTAKQTAQRTLLSQKSEAWRNLTDGQRQSWATYADSNPILDRLGNSIVLSGAQAYIRININRTNAGDSATQSDTPAAATFTPDIIDTTQDAEIDISSSRFKIFLGAGAAQNQILFVHCSKPVSAGVTNTNSNLRLIKVDELSAGEVSNGFINIFTAYEDYIGSISGKVGFRVNVSVKEYDEGLFSTQSKVTGTIEA